MLIQTASYSFSAPCGVGASFRDVRLAYDQPPSMCDSTAFCISHKRFTESAARSNRIVEGLPLSCGALAAAEV